jgi:hypothetical protein
MMQELAGKSLLSKWEELQVKMHSQSGPTTSGGLWEEMEGIRKQVEDYVYQLQLEKSKIAEVEERLKQLISKAIS